MFEKYLDERAAWSIETFGPLDHQRDTRAAAILDHIRKELLEIERAPHDLEEWIDVISLALDGALRCAGAASTEILPALVAKLEKCKARPWPDWRTHPPGQATEHVRSPHRDQRVTAADLAAVRAQELADFVPRNVTVAVSEPVSVREMPSLGGKQPRAAPKIGDHVHAKTSSNYISIGTITTIERSAIGVVYRIHPDGSSSSSLPVRAQQVELVEVESGQTRQQTELPADGEDALRIVRELRELLSVENEGPEGPTGPSWILGQARQILGLYEESDAETLDLTTDLLGGES